jgi:hypothetical protein
MRFISQISFTNGSVRTCYPSDPFLSLASSVLMSSLPLLRPALLLQHLLNGLEHNLVHAGNRGKLCQQLIYILARDAAVLGLEGPKSSPVSLHYPLFTVAEFLNYLRKGAVETLQVKYTELDHAVEAERQKRHVLQLERLLNGSLSFSHFSRVRFTPRKKEILRAYLRGQALVCMDGQAGIDLIIPVLLDAGHTTYMCSDDIHSGDVAPSGVRHSNDEMFLDHATSLKDGIVKRVPVKIDDISIVEQMLGDDDEYSDPESAARAQAWQERISFILIQVENRLHISNIDDESIDPFYSGILEKKGSLQPYLAIRNEMGLRKLEVMHQREGRFGLILGRCDEDNWPCLKYRSARKGECIADKILEIFTTSVEPINLCQDLEDRLALASGGLISEYSFSDVFSESVLEYIGQKRRERSENGWR